MRACKKWQGSEEDSKLDVLGALLTPKGLYAREVERGWFVPRQPHTPRALAHAHRRQHTATCVCQ
eukprot:3843346-Rhodomonas_salina.1